MKRVFFVIVMMSSVFVACNGASTKQPKADTAVVGDSAQAVADTVQPVVDTVVELSSGGGSVNGPAKPVEPAVK
jgi:hypothetical protein